MAVLRCSFHLASTQILFQLGLVGIYFPIGGLFHLHESAGSGLALTILQGIRDGMLFPIIGPFISDWFQILSLSVVLLWILVSLFTAKGVYDQNIFVAPCLADLQEKQRRKLERQHAASGSFA